MVLAEGDEGLLGEADFGRRFNVVDGLSLVTWNSAALFGATTGKHWRQRDKSDVCFKLCNHFDCVFVQGTHGTEGDLVFVA